MIVPCMHPGCSNEASFLGYLVGPNLKISLGVFSCPKHKIDNPPLSQETWNQIKNSLSSDINYEDVKIVLEPVPKIIAPSEIAIAISKIDISIRMFLSAKTKETMYQAALEIQNCSRRCAKTISNFPSINEKEEAVSTIVAMENLSEAAEQAATAIKYFTNPDNEEMRNNVAAASDKISRILKRSFADMTKLIYGSEKVN